MSEIKVLSTPKEILQHIDQRLVEDRFAHIQVRSFENKGVFNNFISQARLWYDPNTCNCKKKGLSEDAIITMFKSLKDLNDLERAKAYRILGSEVELKHEGELVVRLP